LCETKPIRRQVVERKEVMVNWSARRFRRSERTLRRSNAQNKPNSSIADCGLGTDLRGTPPRPAVPVPAGRLYKQTQFALERYKRQVLYGQRVMVNKTCTGLRQNKANFPAGSGPGVEKHGCDYAKQTQFPSPNKQARSRLEPIVRNKANFPQTGRQDHRQGRRPHSQAQGRLWRCHPAGRQLRQTNPIRADAAWDRAAGAWDGGQILRNKPNSSIADCGLGIADWIQGNCRGTGRPSPGPVGQTNPISGGRATHHSTVPLFHHSTILSFHHSNPMATAQSKPNSRQGRRDQGRRSLVPRPWDLVPSRGIARRTPAPRRKLHRTGRAPKMRILLIGHGRRTA
jgi:hypothetical protein